jgi:hypothetical protein
MRPVFDPAARYELHGKDSDGNDHLIDVAPSLLGAYRLRHERHLNLTAYYVLDSLTRNKCSLAAIRDMPLPPVDQ